MSILTILNELAATASSNEKVAILKREEHNKLLNRVFQAAYNPMITYGIKQIPNYDVESIAGGQSLNESIDDLINNFASRKMTGNIAIGYLTNMLSMMKENDAIVIERIIQRDLRCGTSDSLASRVWPGLVPTFDVMLSHKDISGIKFPAYAQLKCLSGLWEMEDNNGNFYKIEDIVKNKLDILVKSYDFETNLVVFKPIIRWLENGIKTKMVRIKYKTQHGEIAYTNLLTADHKMWNETTESWLAVETCQIGDRLKFIRKV